MSSFMILYLQSGVLISVFSVTIVAIDSIAIHSVMFVTTLAKP